MSVSTTQTHPFIYGWAMAAFVLQGQSGRVTTETVLAYKAENIYYLAIYRRSLLTAVLSHRSVTTVRRKQGK